MKITIEGASPEFERKLLLLIDEHRHELTVTAGTEWDAERAVLYLTSLPTNALKFARLVVEADGRKSAEELRAEFDGELRGPTIALSRAVPRGVRMGWWPAGTEAPITPQYDPDHPSWQKAIAYTMTSENVAVFRTALEWLNGGNVPKALLPTAYGGRIVPRAGHNPEGDDATQRSSRTNTKEQETPRQ
ncbi:hypothetical protein [Streptomyces mexicanus]|uniref:hypothetical protein n=1 Tax=Streptomyces mexicanus TaxID=178566 RepID=UPI001F20E47E|nr:hypothetical protein [Streptomyces mexicanus]